MLFCGFYLLNDVVSKPEYDATIMVATKGYLSVEQQTALELRLEEYAQDFDSNGEVSVDLVIISFPVDMQSANPQIVAATQAQFLAQMQSPETMLMLIDQYIYDQIGDETFYEDLSELCPDSEGIYQRYRYNIFETPFADIQYLDTISQLSFVLRNSQSSIVNRSDATLMVYKNQSDMLKRIIMDTPGDKNTDASSAEDLFEPHGE